MNVEKLTHIAKIIAIVTLAIVILTLLFNLLYPLTQKPVYNVETGTLLSSNRVFDPSKIYASNDNLPFRYEGQLPTVTQVEEELPELGSIYGSYRINSCYSKLSQQCNIEILDLCSRYFRVSWNGKEITPLLVMSMCQNETGLRADKNITFCALYPSAVVPPTSVRDISEFNSAKVLQSATTFNALASDWWTRDRGPLQMCTTYGVHDDSFNKQMSTSEKELLSNVSFSTEYTAYTNKEGVITSTDWVSLAAEEGGDRHNIKDICLRMSSELSTAVGYIEKSYNVRDEMQMLCMLSMRHGAGSMWLSDYKNKEISYWRSGSAACEYAEAVSQPAACDYLRELARNTVIDARAHSYNPEVGMATATAMDVYNEFVRRGYIQPKDTYTVDGTYRDGYITYPIKMMYNLFMLQILYNGG